MRDGTTYQYENNKSQGVLRAFKLVTGKARNGKWDGNGNGKGSGKWEREQEILLVTIIIIEVLPLSP